MRNVLLSDLVLRCQRRTDKESDQSISTLEWKALINGSYGSLYSEVERAGMRYFESTALITATGAASYTLVADHLSTIGIDWLVEGTVTGRRRMLTPVQAQERSYLGGVTGTARGYSIVAQLVYLYPNPSSGSYQMLYMPQSPDISAAGDATNVDVVSPDGEEFVIWDAAVKALAKSKDDVSVAINERNEARKLFAGWASDRALYEPLHRVVQDDAISVGGYYGSGWDFV